MKKIAFTLGALSTSTILMGGVMNFLHWRYSEFVLALGIAIFALLFVPAFTKYFYDRPSRDNL